MEGLHQTNDLELALQEHLHEIVPLAVIRRAARHCHRFMDCCRQGLEGKLADYAVKKYKSHRRLTNKQSQVQEIQAQASKIQAKYSKFTMVLVYLRSNRFA